MLVEFEVTDGNVQDVQGQTALHWACVGGIQNMVRLCLSVPGCDVGLRDKDNLTVSIHRFGMSRRLLGMCSTSGFLR